MDIKPIKANDDYRAALREIESLMAAASDSPEGERLDVLTTLVEAFERKHFPAESLIKQPDESEAVGEQPYQKTCPGLP